MFEKLSAEIKQHEFGRRVGRVVSYTGLVIEATGLNACVGEICKIIPERADKETNAEVVGITGSRSLLMPVHRVSGVTLDSKVISTGRMASVSVGQAFLGRVIDAFGEPLDGLGDITSEAIYPLYREASNPLDRAHIVERMDTGVAAIDSMATLGKGQRIGVFAGSGVGKSTLMGMLARNMKSDVNIIALVGERGREVRDFIEDSLGVEGLERSVVVVATAEQSPLARVHAAYTSMAMAEFFCNAGLNVMYMMDSMTRFAIAQREIGLSVGEPPTVRGYTPSVFTSMPSILERAGNYTGKGSITGIITVLVDGDDFNEPITDSLRGILDGHIVLSRELADKGTYPPIDILKSLSRLFPKLVSKEQLDISKKCKYLLSEKNKLDELQALGAYEKGKNPKADGIYSNGDMLKSVFRQNSYEVASFDEIIKELNQIVAPYEV